SSGKKKPGHAGFVTLAPPLQLFRVERRLRIDEVGDQVGDLLRREMTRGAQARHVGAREDGPAVIDFLVGVLRNRFGITALQPVPGEGRPDVAYVDLSGLQRMAVLAQPAVPLALFEPPE